MSHELLSIDERMRGLKNRPYIARSFFWRRSVRQIRALPIPNPLGTRNWQETLSLREARLFGLGVVLLALGSAGVAWLFSLLGWIR